MTKKRNRYLIWPEGHIIKGRRQFYTVRDTEDDHKRVGEPMPKEDAYRLAVRLNKEDNG